MNKYKKIAASVVSIVMAGTMVASLAACNPDESDPNKPNHEVSAEITALLKHMGDSGSTLREITNDSGWTTSKSYWDYLKNNKSTTVSDPYGVLKADGTLNYQTYQDRGNVTLNVAIGHNSAQTSTHFSSSLGTTLTLPDNNTYGNGDLKPAWKAMGEDLNITWVQKYQGQATSGNLSYMTGNKDEDNNTWYSQTDLFTTDLSKAVEYVGKGTSILNLADYLDKMPNFKNYLESNAIVYLSLLQDGMSTTDGSNKTLYVAPYFDGNDDIERYCLIRQDWADKLLNGSTTLENSATFASACKNVAVEEYMQSTGKLTVNSTNATGTGTVKIVKNYDAALAAAKNTSTALGTAYNAIAGAAYNGTSGNIVSIMNAALAANSEATGAQLVNLLRAYIDVCYQTESGSAYYTASNRSDLFNGYDACWDVDDLVALLRCVKTNTQSLAAKEGNEVAGIVPRTGQNDRTPDMVRLAAQLYGVRGADSRYEYTYIDKDGKLQDARNDAEFYEALESLHKLQVEGLVATYPASDSFSYDGGGVDIKKTGTKEAFMMYDYSNTQTKTNFYAREGVSTSHVYSADFNFAPIVTPVAKWDVDGDGNHTDVMRFTESWRSTKTGGLALNGDLAKPENANKLKAALQFVDYLYSEDGQITSTYGPMASANGDGGFWYNAQATAQEISAGNYFTYKGVKYSGTDYKGRTTPTITSKLYQSYLGETVNNFTITGTSDIKGGQLSFTDYARRIIGSTLPVGVKDQSFENQLTCNNGKTGANKVATALALGTVKGMVVNIDEAAADFNWWYVCVPSGLPVSDYATNNVLNAASQDHLKYITGTAKDSKNKNFFSIFNYIILNGCKGTYSGQDESYVFSAVSAD